LTLDHSVRWHSSWHPPLTLLLFICQRAVRLTSMAPTLAGLDPAVSACYYQLRRDR